MSAGPAFAELSSEELRSVDELLDRANHDVAKYMAMTARNVDPKTLGAEELAMLRGDLWQTDGNHAAWELWHDFSRQIAELAPDPSLQAVDEAMDEVAALAQRCAEGEQNEAGELVELVEKTRAAAQSITQLRRTVRRRLIEVLK